MQSLEQYLPYAGVWVMGVALTTLLCPLVYRLAVRAGVLDLPDERKVHREPIPRWGGIAIFLSFFFTLGTGLWFTMGESVPPVARFAGGIIGAVTSAGTQFPSDYAARNALVGLLIGGLIMLVVGMLDDWMNMSARWKLVGQMVAALILYQFGVRIGFLSHPSAGLVFLPEGLGLFLTVFWVVGLTNAVNLLDGLDGLLAGVAGISAAFLCVVSLMKGQLLVAIVLASLSGSAIGFLSYNYNPARMFMGDSGSLFLGMMFASLSIMGALKLTMTLALMVPILIMGLPILDTSWAIVRRAASRRPIFQADKEHLHHRLLNLGLSQKQVVTVIWAINGVLGLVGVLLAYTVK